MTTRDKLATLAANMWWSWNPEALDLFRRLNPEAFRASTNNPNVALQAASEEVIADASFAADVDAVYERFQRYMTEDAPYQDAPRTSYFCMEYGLHESLPIYSGGLGILAGDHVKSTSDLGLPFTAIGLFLRNGYFDQHFDQSGWQLESYPTVNPSQHAITLVRDDAGHPLIVTVYLGHQVLHLQAWLVQVGRTKLYLLDSDLDSNPDEFRQVTHKLYQGDRLTRIQQEIILGIGGVRLLRALGVESDVYHMNEGHCAFLTLELLNERLKEGYSKEDAEAWVRDHAVFTTHTPVIAGHDRFSPGLFVEQMAGFRHQSGLSDFELLAYGRVNPDDAGEEFTMTVLGLKLSRAANGVSELNGEVARRQWQHLYGNCPSSEVPIGAITNGIHVPTWAAPHARPFLTKYFGDVLSEHNNPEFWHRIDNVPDDELWAYRRNLRAALVEYANEHTRTQSLVQHPRLSPDVLTIGFARRFATYKRAPLLFYDLERAIRIITNAERPVQVIYAGKAHPADEGGKRFLQQIYQLSQHPALEGRLIVLENYNMEVGRMLISGCDVWLNNPRRPMEASGTSGQKIAAHGGLNVSILDGWWPEGSNGQNGWNIGDDASADYRDPDQQDAEDAGYLYDLLEKEVVPAYYDRNEHGLPTGWISRVRNAMRTLTYEYSSSRMVTDYIETMYSTANVDSRSDRR